MFKIQKRTPEEDSTAPKELEPSDVIKTLNCSTSINIIRKRNNTQYLHSQIAPVFLPHQAAKKLNEKMMATDDSLAGSMIEQIQMKERIFSISSNTVSSNKNVIKFLASICLFASYFLIPQIADAQFSSVGSNHNSQYNSQKSPPSEIRMMSFGNNQAAVQGGMQSIVTPSSLQARGDGRFVSIDRFDSGEQIRPPLLGQPTTLAPSSKSQQVSAYQQGNFNMEASASDSYMTPEERDQLLRQQENHYEGREPSEKSSNQRQGDKAGYYNPNSLTKDGSSSVNADEQSEPVLGARSLQSDATNNAAAAAAGNDSDDSDYDQDEEPQQQEKQKKAVPSRAGSGASSKKQQAKSSPETRRTMHANDNGDESEPSDDFGGVNDDAYFNRKPNSGSGLNHAATQHQNRGSSEYNSRQNARTNYNSDNKEADQGKHNDDGQGFGPGPNEAYLADQADSSSSSGKAGTDSEDDGDASNVNDMDAGKLDRRSSQDSKMNPTATDKTAATSPQQDSFNSDDDDSDAEESADSSEDSFVPRVNSQESGSSSQQTVPRESASAVTPSVATAASSIQNVRSPANSSPVQAKSSLPLFGIQRQPLLATNKQYMQQQQQQHHAPTTGSNSQPPNFVANKHQKSAFNAAYNPQNNPSHIGKFFIN